jgi:NitT/TauT family transport system permease protein
MTRSHDGRLARVIRQRLPSATLFASVLVVWELAVHILKVPSYLLPAPSVVFLRIVSDWPSLSQNVWVTLEAAISGFVIGTLVAVLAAFSFLYSKTVEQAVFPWAVVIKTIPIIAIAPLLTIWLGFGMAPKIAVAAIGCIFPTLVNMNRGLGAVDQRVIDYLRVLRASPRQLLIHARIYNALPYLFSAMKITVGMAMVGAIVAEFTGANFGIGTIIVNAGYRQDATLLFSAIFLSSIATLVLYYIVLAIEKVALFWPGATADH